MKKFLIRVALTALGLLFSWNGSYADEGGIVADLTNFLKSIKPGQYLTYHDSFNINLLQLYLEKTPTTEGGLGDLVGFNLKIDLGKDTEVFRVVGLGRRDSGIKYDLSSRDTDLFRIVGIGGDEYDLQEAYFHALAPVGKGIDIYVGKFFTLAGADVMESKDSYNFSPSLLFDFAIPVTLTGLRLHYATGPLDFTIGVNNGWNPWQVQDIYNGKAVEARIGLTHGIFSLGVVDLVGSDKSNLDGHLRNDLDFVASLTPTKKLNFVANFDYGIEKKVTNADLGLVDKNIKWWGVGSYVVYDVNNVVRFILRSEYFDDRNGARTLSSATPIPGEKKYWEITPTIQLKPFANYKPLDNFIVRLEYRHDQANKDVFDTGNGDLRKSQDTIAAEFVYHF